MRKLDRAAYPAPPCLEHYDHNVNRWEDVRREHKAEIRVHLETMQGRRCAYCEGDLDALGQHIEHFRRKAHPSNRGLTFDWDNLLWSCDRTDSCGHFKDHGAGAYNVAEIINPCTDNPDEFFIFRSDGTISVRRGISPGDERRARETLRVFGLDAESGRLRKMRKIAVAPYVKDADEAFNQGWPLNEIQEFFASELTIAQQLPFYTAIRHVLTER